MFKYGIILLCGLGVFLPIGAYSESYDRSLEATAPGEWMQLTNRGVTRFRFLTRCAKGGVKPPVCLSQGHSTLASVKAPQGWELKWGDGWSGGGTQTILKKVAISGESLLLRCEPNYSTNSQPETGGMDPNVYGCARELWGRRLDSKAAGGFVNVLVKMDYKGLWVRSVLNGFIYGNGVWESGSVEGIRNEPQYQPKIARLDYSSHVRFTKGEQVKFLKITASTSTARLQVNISGPGANVLTLGNSDTGVIGLQACDGTIRTGMTCFITTKNNIEWYGEKQAIARITLSVT